MNSLSRMNSRMTILGAALLSAMPSLAAQNQSPQPLPDPSASQQLIAWSRIQKPRPTPQPIPPPDKGTPQPDQQSAQAPQPQTPTQPKVETQTFTGKIVKAGDKYVLKGSSMTYQLDEQSGVQKYEDKDVKVVGTLDAGSNTIRVTRIDLLS